LVLLLGALGLPVDPAFASHFRYSHITWRPTGTPGEVVFTVSSSFRRAAPGTGFSGYPGTASDGGLAVGDTFSEIIGATRLFFGDGAQTPTLIYRVDAINTVEDWVIGHAINPTTGSEWRHTFAGTGPYTARIDSCCRTGVELNNPGRSYEVSTIVDLSIANASPVSAIAPIVACPQGACIFQIPAADTDADTLGFRLSTATEAGDTAFQHPGQGSADPLTISSLGLVTWDSTNFNVGLYSNSVTLEESRPPAGTHGKVMLDYLINTAEFLGNAPVIDVPPTPENAENIDVNAVLGETLSVTVQCSDPDAGDIVTLGHLGLPGTAMMSPSIAIGNPATAQITWAPILTQAAAISLSCTDTNGNKALPHAFSVNVEGIMVPPGPDRDNDLFCDGLTINQLIASGIYNVIDNDLKPSAVLVGTNGRDLIIAGGLGDVMYGLGDDDCIIGGIAEDYASGGAGADQLFGWNGTDVLEGDAGDDLMVGYDQNDFMLGGTGNDTIHGQDNEDWIQGGAGHDVMTGGDDIDRIDGDAGDDDLTGDLNDDVLNGGSGDDLIDGVDGGDLCVVDATDSVPAANCGTLTLVSSAPVLVTSIGDPIVDEQGSLSLLIVADDSDPPGGPEPVPGSGLSFSSARLPAFVTLTDNGNRTATLDVIPAPGSAGSYPGIIIRVDDDGEPVQSDIEVIDLTVSGGNLAPALALIGNQTLNETDSLAVGIVATDPNLTDALTFVPTGLPPFASLTDHGNGTATLGLNPVVGDAGQYHGVTIRAFDDGVPVLFAEEIFSIIVNAPVNNAPSIVTAVGNVTIEEGQSLSIPMAATDPDVGQTLTWSLQNTPGLVSISDLGGGNAQLDFNPAGGDAGIYAGNVVTVADNGTPQLIDSVIFMVTVTVAVTDSDADTIPDISDNCTLEPNPLQRDSNLDGYGNLCDADLDNDGNTNSIDLGLIGIVFLTADADADINGDGNVNSLDLGLVVPMFFKPPGPSGVAP
jgi:hypothetical protein